MLKSVVALLIAAMVTAAAALTAVAQDLTYASWEGHQYRLTCNAEGIVLRSIYPVVRFSGQGASMREIVGIEKLYLGKNCDAWSEALGEGQWQWANAGFWANFEQREIRFARQEPVCPEPPAFDIFACEDR